jgi:hypothetical protein
MKDWLLSKALKVYVRDRVARYGELKSMAVNSQERTIDVAIQPHGEMHDVHLRVVRYSLLVREGKHLLTIDEATASRPWIAHLLEDYLRGRTFELPPIAAAVL